MPSYLITGSSRGLGLAMVTELLKNPDNVVLATARNPATSKGLQELAGTYPKSQLALITLDLTVPEQIASAAKEAAKLLPNGLDCLINNAAICEQMFTPFDELDVDKFTEEVKFHTTPIIHILRAFKPLVAKSEKKKVVFIGSAGGSLSNVPDDPVAAGVAFPYGVGKAAQNMIARKWGAMNKGEGIATVIIHPGWLDTEMGNVVKEFVRKHAPAGHSKMGEPLKPEVSARGVLKVAHEASLQDAVSFMWYDGRKIDW